MTGSYLFLKIIVIEKRSKMHELLFAAETRLDLKVLGIDFELKVAKVPADFAGIEAFAICSQISVCYDNFIHARNRRQFRPCFGVFFDFEVVEVLVKGWPIIVAVADDQIERFFLLDSFALRVLRRNRHFVNVLSFAIQRFCERYESI